jgi:hypothetical protein
LSEHASSTPINLSFFNFVSASSAATRAKPGKKSRFSQKSVRERIKRPISNE